MNAQSDNNLANLDYLYTLTYALDPLEDAELISNLIRSIEKTTGLEP